MHNDPIIAKCIKDMVADRCIDFYEEVVAKGEGSPEFLEAHRDYIALLAHGV